ncbi:MAG: 50S ribosomal protein L28 [Candidatus Sumerlaeia bacterium]|nr:50S ribosomal protein L28 [Candidatus Sumerlaeia bacterium]
MARCRITGKGTRVGNNVSHANNRTKRTFKANIQKIRVVVEGKVQRLQVSTRAIKAGKVQKAARGQHAAWLREQGEQPQA